MKHYKRPRLYVDTPLKKGHVFALEKEQAHYLSTVLRLNDGETVRVFNGSDGEWLCHFQRIGKKESNLICVDSLKEQPAPKKETYLFFTPLKKARLDFLIEKAVELGVGNLCPIVTQNCAIRDIKPARLQAQIIEAAEQCERLTVPKLHDIQKLDACLKAWNGDMPIAVALERADCDCPHISDISANALMIGPEGGWSEDEKDLFTKKTDRFITVSLGETILRAETASLVALTFILK